MSDERSAEIIARAPLGLVREKRLLRLTRPPFHVTVAEVDGTLHAFEDACPHSGVSLATGTLRGHRLRCPGHDWEIDVRTGEVVVPDFLGCSTPCFDVAIEGDEVVVRERAREPSSPQP